MIKSISKNSASRLAAAALCVAVLAGCQTNQNPKQTAGAVLGAVGGAVIGAQFGKGTGQLVAVAAGTLAGTMIGSKLGRDLDEADRTRASQTTQATLEKYPTGQTGSWDNPDSGNSGTVTPTRTYTDSSYAPCREYTSTVMIGGEQETVVGNACRGEDGTWRVAN